MTRHATAISISARGALIGFLLSGATIAQAQKENVRDQEPGVADVATTPITDLNLAKDDIPEILLTAAKQPYAAPSGEGCDAVGAAIAELDQVLGPDYDLVDQEKDRISEGRIAKSVIGSFIPFRSIIREISGAADHQRQFQEAIMAGMVRRGYLKGLGEAAGCAYPARPLFTRIAVDGEEVTELEEMPDPSDTSNPPPERTYTSNPVVQGENEPG